MPLTDFKNDESAAVTVDWVVLTAAIVGIAIAVIAIISGGINSASNDISNNVGTQWDFNFGSKNAATYFDMGIEAFPDDQDQAWRSARLSVDGDSPTGFEYDPNMTTTRYVDNATGSPIFVSDDGTMFSIDGEIVAVADYDISGAASFKSTFDGYWNETQ